MKQVLNYSIKTVTTEKELFECYELRKKIFGDELKDDRFIVDDKYFIDPWDKIETLNFIAIDSKNNIIGTLRAYKRNLGEYIYDDLYFSEKLTEKFAEKKTELISKSVIISRGCVEPKYRGNGIYTSLIKEILTSLEKGTIAIVCIETWNKKSMSPFIKFGFEVYQTGETRPGYEYNWIAKRI